MSNGLDCSRNGWIVGWRKIAKYCDVSIETAITLHKRFNMPVMELPTGTRVALSYELDEWVMLYNENLNQRGVKNAAISE